MRTGRLHANRAFARSCHLIQLTPAKERTSLAT